jgi:hypothetical protein
MINWRQRGGDAELTRGGLRAGFEHLKSDDLASRAWYKNRLRPKQW